MFRWLLFFCLIVGAIVTFCAFVLGVQLPFISPSPYQPSSPFQP